MATHSSILAWEIPWTEETGRLYNPWSCKRDKIYRLNNNNPRLGRFIHVFSFNISIVLVVQFMSVIDIVIAKVGIKLSLFLHPDFSA